MQPLFWLASATIFISDAVFSKQAIVFFFTFLAQLFITWIHCWLGEALKHLF